MKLAEFIFSVVCCFVTQVKGVMTVQKWAPKTGLSIVHDAVVLSSLSLLRSLNSTGRINSSTAKTRVLVPNPLKTWTEGHLAIDGKEKIFYLTCTCLLLILTWAIWETTTWPCCCVWAVEKVGTVSTSLERHVWLLTGAGRKNESVRCVAPLIA